MIVNTNGNHAPLTSFKKNLIFLKGSSFGSFVTVALIIFIFSIALSLFVGSTDVNGFDILISLLNGESNASTRIFLHVRLPRTFACVLAGGALAVAGVIIQAVLGNPLASPNIIGVNSGAGFAVVLCCAFFPNSPSLVASAAFIGALFSTLLIYAIARKTNSSKVTLVLAGIALSSILSAGIDTVITFVPDALPGITSFRIGGVAGTTMAELAYPAIYIFVAFLIILLISDRIDILGLGEDVAKSLGLNVKLYRFTLLLTASALAGSAVSFAGLLGFIGLIIPHTMRFFVGSESKKLILLSALGGSAFVCICDVLARVLFAPFEISVGIIMSFVGAPFFLWLLVSRKKGGK